MDIMNLNNLFLTTAQGDLLRSQDQIILRNMVHLSLLKCGNVEMESMIDQGNLSKILGIHWKKSILFVENIFSAEPRILQGTKKLFTKERGDPIQIKPCTSYSRTNDYVKLRINGYDIAYNFTHNNIMLEHNAMNNMNTVAHMNVHNTQY